MKGLERTWRGVWATDLSTPSRRYHRSILFLVAVALVSAAAGDPGVSVMATPLLALWLCSEIRSSEWWMKQAYLKLEDLDREVEERQ